MSRRACSSPLLRCLGLTGIPQSRLHVDPHVKQQPAPSHQEISPASHREKKPEGQSQLPELPHSEYGLAGGKTPGPSFPEKGVPLLRQSRNLPGPGGHIIRQHRRNRAQQLHHPLQMSVKGGKHLQQLHPVQGRDLQKAASSRAKDSSFPASAGSKLREKPSIPSHMEARFTQRHASPPPWTGQNRPPGDDQFQKTVQQGAA